MNSNQKILITFMVVSAFMLIAYYSSGTTATKPASTATNPASTATKPASTATNPDYTATQPASTATQPDYTATNPDYTATNPASPTWESRGCFLDAWERAIPNRTSATDYKTCKADAIAGGYNVFALQNGNACFVGKDSNYAKYGATTCGDLGGAWKNNVYALSNVPIKKAPPALTWCKNGIYSNGVPVPESEAQVGATVCGGNNIKYTCNPSGIPYWSKTGKACDAGMKGMK
jgi:hypothetical protein